LFSQIAKVQWDLSKHPDYSGPMHVISRKKLVEFWEKEAQAEQPLTTWFQATEAADWSNVADVKPTFNSADRVKHLTVFDIGGNKYRLIAFVDYQYSTVFVRAVLRHKEYDRGLWKADEFGAKPHPSRMRKKGTRKWQPRR
jgi:mRNA interferase HigB